MIVLVGANSFLGRHTCELLERRGEPGVVVSRTPDRCFFERFAPSLRVMDAVEFASPSGRSVIANATAIVYFVWSSVPATFAEEPWRELTENVTPAFKFFLRIADISPNAKIVFMSSGGTVYGGQGDTPKSETDATYPISPYGTGKLMAEEVLRFVGRTRNVPFAILRVSNAVGRWQTSDRQGIVGVALRAARDRVPVKLFGGGTQVRDFVDANDVADAIHAASLNTDHPATTWNIGSGVGITIHDLIEDMSRVIGRPILIDKAPARSLDVPHIVLNCRKAAEDLSWKANTPIEHSISALWQSVCNP